MGVTKFKTKHVAPLFQRMKRAEFGAEASGLAYAVSKGMLIQVHRRIGECVCVTCGRVCPWECGSGERQLHCGHFIAGRGSILFEEDCVAPQCSGCNKHHSGRPLEFRVWMEHVRGLETIERLERIKHHSLTRTRDEMVDSYMLYNQRLKAAQTFMKGK